MPLLELMEMIVKRIFALIAITMLTPSSIHGGAKIDPRLATVKKAFVIPVDDLADDKPVSTCFADHLKGATPIEGGQFKGRCRHRI
jgi:hypothetical protein